MYNDAGLTKPTYATSGLAAQQYETLTPLTMRQRLERQKSDLTERIAAIDDALKALDSTPDFENVMNAVAKAQCY